MTTQFATLTSQTALGTTQATGLAIPPVTGYVQVSTCTTSAYAIALPLFLNGQTMTIRNDGVSPLSVFPPKGLSPSTASGTIDSASAGTAYVLQSGATVQFISKDGWALSSLFVSQPVGANGTPSPASLVLPVTGGATLTSSSPSVIYVPTLTANSVFNLPAPFAGMNFKIVFAVTATETKTCTFTGTSAVMYGSAIQATGTAANNVGVPISAKTNLIYTAATAGDSVSITSDGTNYYVAAISSAITISVS